MRYFVDAGGGCRMDPSQPTCNTPANAPLSTWTHPARRPRWGAGPRAAEPLRAGHEWYDGQRYRDYASRISVSACRCGDQL